MPVANASPGQLVDRIVKQQQQRVNGREQRLLVDIVGELVARFVALPRNERAAISDTRTFIETLAPASEALSGSGIGATLSAAEGQHRLSAMVRPRPVEEWAGPVAGPGEIERTFGIARSTLQSWFDAGAIIGLRAGTRKRAYPLEQFVNSRPVAGIDAVLRLAPSAESAWLWLRQPHGAFDGRMPLDLLRADDKQAVEQQAAIDFG